MANNCKTDPRKAHFRASQYRLVSAFATVQSSATQKVTVTDSSGSVVFTASGKSSSGGEYTVIGEGTFLPSQDGKYTVEMTAGSGNVKGRGIASVDDVIQLKTLTFGSNDGGCDAGDRDFNDLVVILTGYRNRG
ncbi:MAG: fucose-binding lectin II [Holophagales bacterium]|nr:fucose-binding lectin II [Holophagales bacterium]